jgi:predicted esterase
VLAGRTRGESGGPDARILIVHDDIDPIVPHYQSKLLEAALKTPGVPASFRAVTGNEQKVGRSWFSCGLVDGIIPR